MAVALDARSRPASRDRLLHAANGRSVPWLLAAQAAARPTHPFLVWEGFDGARETWTYAAFASEARRFASGLRGRGIGHGDRVLLHLENCPEFLLAWFACSWLGAVPVLTNTRSTADEMGYFLEHSRPVAAITQPSLAPVVDRHGGLLQWVAVTGRGAAGELIGPDRPDRGSSFDALRAEVENGPVDVRSSDPATIQYTSGTTARPKGVVWTHANAVWGAQVCAHHEGLTAADVHLVHLPLFHTNALMYSVLATLWAGATAVLQPRFSASRFWEVSQRNRCTWTALVAYAYRALAAHEVPSDHAYRLWGSGTCRELDGSGFPRTIGWWGMTETVSHPIIGDPAMENRPGSMGRPAPEYQVAIVREDGTTVDDDETGNLLVRGVPGVSLFLEYLDDEQATAAAFDERGWLRTGDLVTPRADGSIDFSERAKDILKVGGENVAASDVERVILAVPGVREVAVVAAPHRMLDQVPVAFVVPDAGDGATLPAVVLAACTTKLSAFKVPRHVVVVDDLPRSTLNKVAKGELRARARRQFPDADLAGPSSRPPPIHPPEEHQWPIPSPHPSPTRSPP